LGTRADTRVYKEFSDTKSYYPVVAKLVRDIPDLRPLDGGRLKTLK